MFTAALVFAVYYNLSGVAQTWVERGMLDEIPGVWWLHALLALVAALLLGTSKNALRGIFRDGNRKV